MFRYILILMLAVASLLAQQPVTAPPASALEDGLYATLTTSLGVIKVKFFEKESPITVRNFVLLSKGGKSWLDPKTKQNTTRPMYPGTIFHRVIPGFMIQGGDPTGTGMGNPGFTIKDEFHPTLKFDQPGRLAMANIGEPNTGACQFFLTEVPTPSLNGKHTIFGQIVKGEEFVAQIARTPRDGNDKPRIPVVLKSVTIERVGPVPDNAPESPRRPTPPAAAPKKK